MEITLAVLLSLLGLVTGILCSRLRSPWWLLGYGLPLTLVLMIGIPRWLGPEAVLPGFALIVTGKTKFMIIAAAITAMLITPYSRIRLRSFKLLTLFSIVWVTIFYALMPFAWPILCNDTYSRLTTRIDEFEICRQTTSYTCGPAASVTALRFIGLHGEEGELARLAYTTPTSGTQGDMLSEALQKRYGAQGLQCSYQSFDSVNDLRENSVSLIEVKWSLLTGHWVAVLKVTDDWVIIGDPAEGLKRMSHEDFRKWWVATGIVLRLKEESNSRQIWEEL